MNGMRTDQTVTPFEAARQLTSHKKHLHSTNCPRILSLSCAESFQTDGEQRACSRMEREGCAGHSWANRQGEGAVWASDIEGGAGAEAVSGVGQERASG